MRVYRRLQIKGNMQCAGIISYPEMTPAVTRNVDGVGWPVDYPFMTFSHGLACKTAPHTFGDFRRGDFCA